MMRTCGYRPTRALVLVLMATAQARILATDAVGLEASIAVDLPLSKASGSSPSC